MKKAEELNPWLGVGENEAGHPLIIGCNYHTTWQSAKGMRFVLDSICGDRVKLKTRKTRKTVIVSVHDVIFITTDCNVNKACRKTGVSLPIMKEYLYKKNNLKTTAIMDKEKIVKKIGRNRDLISIVLFSDEDPALKGASIIKIAKSNKRLINKLK